MAAVFHATWNALIKTAGDRLVSIAVMMGTGGLLSIPFMIVLPLPAPPSWPFIAASVAIHTLYYLTLVKAYEAGDLSQVYPIARGSSPLYVALLGVLFAGEVLGPWQSAAVVVICLGIFSLSFSRGVDRIKPQPLIYAVIVGLTIGLYSFTDGMGVRRTAEPLSYISWMFFFECIPISIIAALRRRRMLAANLRMVWRNSAAGGAIGAVGYGAVIWAMSITPMAHVAALRETSVIIAAFIGTRMLGESGGRWRIGAAVVVALGIIGLQLSAHNG